MPRSSNETPEMREAFVAYYGLGPRRTFKQCAKKTGEPISTLAQWAKRFDWAGRIERGEIGKMVEKASKPKMRVEQRAAVNYLLARRIFSGKSLMAADMRDALQNEFLKAYFASGGNPAEACRQAEIRYETYQGWRHNDHEFCQAMLMIDEARDDYVVSALLRKIQDGDIQAIMFYLRNRRPDLWNEKRFDKPIGMVVNNLNSQSSAVTDLSQVADDRQHLKDVIQIMQEVGGLGLLGIGEEAPAEAAAPGEEAADDRAAP